VNLSDRLRPQTTHYRVSGLVQWPIAAVAFKSHAGKSRRHYLPPNFFEFTPPATSLSKDTWGRRAHTIIVLKWLSCRSKRDQVVL
jgi:hypothetical protein